MLATHVPLLAPLVGQVLVRRASVCAHDDAPVGLTYPLGFPVAKLSPIAIFFLRREVVREDERVSAHYGGHVVVA